MAQNMICIAVFLAQLVTASFGANANNNDLEWGQRFEAYASKHAPELLHSASEAEFSRRLGIFRDNAALVAELRLSQPHAEFSLEDSPFSHLSFAEFSATRLPKMSRGRAPSKEEATSEIKAPQVVPEEAAPTSLPAAYDWRTATPVAVTPVKDQGAMGSCWAFSAAANIEGQRAIASKGAQMDDVSVEQLIECDDQSGIRSVDHSMNADCGVFGGWPYLAYQYWIKSGGVRAWKEMPYCAGIQYGQPGCCLPCMVHGYNKTLCGNHNDLFCNTSTTLGQGPQRLCEKGAEGALAQLKDWRRIPNNATKIAEELISTGPLSIALDATIAFQFYKRGVLDPSTHPVLGGCAKTDPELNHAVLLVGYGEDGSKPYWTVKNSWGTKWGEAGYFRFAKGSDKCGIESEATTAILK